MMTELDEVMQNTEQRAKAIARLLTLIEMDSAIIARERAEGMALMVDQYESLRANNVALLTQLIEGSGTLLAHLQIRPAAA
jgi:hypothetical protein